MTLPAHASDRYSHFPASAYLFLFGLILIISFYSSHSFAQYTYELDKTTRFDKMDVEQGLSSALATCIHQDKYGFIWIATQIGLNLYNGYEVKVFSTGPKNPGSIFNGLINDIYEEPDGTMWFCTVLGLSRYNRHNQTFSNYLPDTSVLFNEHNTIKQVVQDGMYFWVRTGTGLLRFNKETGQFHRYAKDTLDPSRGIYSNSVDYLLMDASGTLWVATTKYGKDEDPALNKFNKESGTFEHFLLSYPDSKPGGFVSKMMEDREGTLWLTTNGYGLIELTDKNKGTFRYYTHDENDENSIHHNNVEAIFEDSKGNIWTGGTNGFSLFDKNSGQFTNYHVPRIYIPQWVNLIRDIHEDSKGNLWMNTVDGLLRFNPSTKSLTQYLYDPDNPEGINDNNLRDVMIDRTDQVWVANWTNGVATINPYSNAFRIIRKNPSNSRSLSDNFVSRFFQDSRGNLWIGCFLDGGLDRTNLNNHKVYENFSHFVYEEDNPKSISGGWIMPIYEDRDHIIWIGNFHGLNSYDYLTNSFTRYRYDPNDSTTLSNNVVESVLEDSQGTFWVGTRNGLNILDRETGKCIQLIYDADDSTGILNRQVRVIFEDSFGEVWFGGTFIEKLNRADTSFIHYLPDPANKSDLYRTSISEIAEDDSSNLWFASMDGGLFKMNRNNTEFTSITTDDGLPSNDIEGLEIDDNGDIWAATNRGLSRIKAEDQQIKNFDVADGLVNDGLVLRSLYKDNEGWLFVGGKDGFNVFHPDSIKENKFIPPVYITSLKVAGEPKYFDRAIYELEEIELQYNENDFSFDFVALNYINSQKNQYAYMLEGYDEDWNYVGNRRTAFYTNLGPGKYTFRVKGSNNDGYWNEEGARLALVILPPFWKTWWAYVIYAVAFIFLVYYLRRNELRKINLRQNLELKNVQAEQLAALDIEKNKFFSNISHEFRTPLTLILGPLDRIIGKINKDDLKQELDLVRRNARRLQALINQLLSLSKLESGKMKLRTRPENIVKLTRLFLQSFSSMAEHNGVQLEFESDAEEYIVFLDKIKFEKVANNLFSNALKFTEAGDEINVSITRADTFPIMDKAQSGIRIRFSDTGKGINKDDLPHVFDRFYQVDEAQMKTMLGTGIGLALTKELVELHHGAITVDSEWGKGTTFTIILPLGKDHLSADEIIGSGKIDPETEDELLIDDYIFTEKPSVKSGTETESSVRPDLPLILIVEDNDDMRSYIKSYLVNSYNIIEAVNGKEGADKAIEHIPDLIVSDLMMPIVDGNQMTTQLKTDERTSHIPIILLTAKASRESKLEGLETGADDFLTKPFDAEELLVRIRNLIDQRKKLSALLSQHIGNVSQTRLIKESAGKAMSKIDEEFLRKAKEIIDADMADPEFSVEVLAGKLAMTRMQLHRKLTSLTENSARDFIRNIRMVKAAELLKEGNLNVTQVSYEIGISSLSNFARTFKEKYGVNPSEYK